jgi:hypothetical protein
MNFFPKKSTWRRICIKIKVSASNGRAMEGDNIKKKRFERDFEKQPAELPER